MRGHLTEIERRWRTIAGNPKASIKLRLAALAKMKNASDRFLSGFLQRCNNATLEFAANEMRAKLREEVFKQKLLAGTLVNSAKKDSPDNE